MGEKWHLQSRVHPLESFLPLNIVLLCVFSFSTVFFNAWVSSFVSSLNWTPSWHWDNTGNVVIAIFFNFACGIIDLVTVFDAILTSRQTCEKLQCLYENLMSNNFRKTAVLKKISLNCKVTEQRILLKNFGGVPVLKFPQRLALDFPYICL